MTISEFFYDLDQFLENHAVDMGKIWYYDTLYGLMPEEFKDRYYTVAIGDNVFVNGLAADSMDFFQLHRQMQDFIVEEEYGDIEMPDTEAAKAFLARMEKDFWNGEIAEDEDN